MDRFRARLDPEERFGLRFSLLALAVLLVAVPFGALLVQVTGEGPFTRVDTSAANHLHHWVRTREWSVDLLRVVTTLGATWWLTLVVAVATVVLVRDNRVRPAVFLVTTSITAGLLIQVVKALVARPRPSLVAPVATAFGKSFPSGHTMGATVVYGALIIVFLPLMSPPVRRAVIAVALVVVAAVAFSRLALGVHYISDVLAGFVLGLAWLAAATAAFRLWRVERVEEGEPP